MKYIPTFIFLYVAIVLGACKTEYQPPVNSIHTGFLVVEGFIDGSAPTEIRLSRTRALTDDKFEKLMESNATVYISDGENAQFPLFEAEKGIYRNQYMLDPAKKYRLNIQTSEGKQYVSELMDYKKSPAIDSLAWRIKDDVLQVHVNTRDPQSATKYYRWAYEETWEFHSTYFSLLQYYAPTNTVISRDKPVYQCWQRNESGNILTGTSARLNEDVISMMPLAGIKKGDEKLSVLYSIQVKQFPLDLKGYNYWQAMRKNTEEIGSIFDPQPSQVKGNIQCISDSSETVIGYINAGSTSLKRIFIKKTDLPLAWRYLSGCELIVVPNTPDSIAYYFGGGLIPVNFMIDDMGREVYTGSTATCVDCTTRGTDIKPDFWP